MITALATGFFTSVSLILAIGAQNSVVLRQGLARSHVFWTCLFCAVSDIILILAGVAGFAYMVEYFPALPVIFLWGGILFLTAYAFMRLFAAYKGDYSAEIAGKPKPLAQIIAILFAVTWLNPHVYLDTLGLLGAISLKFEPIAQKTAFAFGASFGSMIFFFSLGYGARLLAPYFKSAKVWRILDVIIACVMFAIAFGLYASH